MPLMKVQPGDIARVPPGIVVMAILVITAAPASALVLVLALALALVLVLALALACARRPCLEGFFVGPATLASAVYAALPLALPVAQDLELWCVPVVQRQALISERFFRYFAAVTEHAGRLNHPAGVAWDAGYPAAWSFYPQALPAFPAVALSAWQAQLVRPVSDSVAAPWGHAAGNGSSVFEAFAAAPLAWDTDPLNTAAGKQVAGQVSG